MDRACIAVVDPSRARLFSFDRRNEHLVEEYDVTEPARAIIARLREVLRATHARRLIVCATPRTLRELRAATGELVHEGLEVDEVPRDLVELAPHQLRAQLASYGLLPALCA